MAQIENYDKKYSDFKKENLRRALESFNGGFEENSYFIPMGGLLALILY